VGVAMMNIHNRLVTFDQLKEPGLMGGIVPIAPTNQLSMLTDYIVPKERVVACPNQDVVYGFSILSLDREAVVIQVPDFGSRYSTGGSIDGMIRATETNLAKVTDTMIVIPGHGAIGDKSQRAFYRDLLVGTREKVAALKKQGKSLDEIVAAKAYRRDRRKVGQRL
jgi:Protein of unknown function (DUF1254)